MDRRSRSCPRRGCSRVLSEHYAYLLAQAKGGTKHTIASVPRWDGLWVTAGNTHMDIFIDPPGFPARFSGVLLTPPYEAAYTERWAAAAGAG